MKRILYIFILLSTIQPCFSQNQEDVDFSENINPVLREWNNYYKSLSPEFSLDDFTLDYVGTFNFMEGNIFGIFHEKFDSVYYKFLIFNSDSTLYIDMDSYQWHINDEGNFMGNVDQEIDLVDIHNKKVERIMFFGPSKWVEDAFWNNDSIIFFLINSVDNIPEIGVLNLDNKEYKNYIYKNKIDKKIEYSVLRFKRNGLNK